MSAKGEGKTSIAAFERSYELLCGGSAGMITESEIEPPAEVLEYDSLSEQSWDEELLNQTVVVKLNGGLGTGMGLQKAKSLLEVKEGQTFLDLIAGQIIHLREDTGSQVRCLFMNSFSTSDDTLAYLSKYADAGLGDASEIEMVQSQVPKVDAETLAPAVCAEDASLEWCPPGHGDIYTVLEGSGWLDRFLEQGVKYAFVSNSDNLGATLCPKLLEHFATSQAPFMMEVTRRTEADRKGGHLAKRVSDGQLLLREVAQCPDEDAEAFQDIDRHRYFNTNNLWVDLEALKVEIDKLGGVLPLPVIKNKKTVNPRDKESAAVWQLETAMGAAIECFEGSSAVAVPRSRFAPVKTTSDLLALRSDAYEIRSDSSLGLVASRAGKPPVVKLSDHYKMLDGLSSLGNPSLVDCEQLEVEGLVEIPAGTVIKGKVAIVNSGEAPLILDSGSYENEEISA